MFDLNNIKNPKELYHLQFGMNAITKPLNTSKPPTTRRYHFDGIFISKSSDSGNTFEYFTYSFL